MAEANLLVAGAEAVVAVVVAAATVYYAFQAHRAVSEARDLRVDNLQERRAAAIQAMTGAVAELATLANAAGLQARRRGRRRAHAALLYPCAVAVASLSQALDGIRLLGDPALTHRAAQIFDHAVDYYTAAVGGAPQRTIQPFIAQGPVHL